MNSNARSIETTWRARILFILATIGAMVGSGSIWRFPRLVAMYGGAAFLIPYSIAVFTVAIPLLIAEGIIGRETRCGVVHGFAKYAGREYAWLGAWIMWVNTAIMFYYSVVCGWSLAYFIYGLSGVYGVYKPGMGIRLWSSFIGSVWQPILFTAVVWLLTWIVLVKGTRGIEHTVRVMVPSIFIILALVLIRAITMKGSEVGLEYMFRPEIHRLTNAEVWLQAYSQVLWSTGAGWGIFLTYCSYLRKDDDINLNAAIAALGVSSAAVLAGPAVITTVAVTAPLIGIDPLRVYAEGNVGLTFIWLTELFPLIPFGAFIGTLFFLALFFAAFTSQIAIAEVPIKVLTDFGISRRRAATYVCIAGMVLALPAAISIDWLNNQDWVWGVGLLLNTLMLSIVMVRTGLERNRHVANRGSDIVIGRWWNAMVGFVAPLSVAMVLTWWIVQSISWYPDWWNPLKVFSTGTALLQWSLAMSVIYVVVNRVLASRLSCEKPQR
ncbi:MAG TPA: sodium-dependent transporter [Ignisphaera aggregans]|uniref:Sodium-dependent transporter n=1 Tax=Ignisphaera aggregans TaxID=334771 RepID=A0A832YYN7_9CREN|nr:sodium-dependent transporter [Ignisphaera aggregans]